MKTDTQKYSEAVWRQGAPARSAAEDRLLATGTIVPRRITMALDAGGLYGPEVDEACGAAEPMVDWWEAGAATPNADQVRLLAKLTGYTVEWFFRPVEVEIDGPMFICSRPGGCQVVMPDG